MSLLAAAYPTIQVGQETFDIYASRLAVLEFEQARQACEALIDEWPRFPAISEVLAVALGGMSTIRPGGITAEEIERMTA